MKQVNQLEVTFNKSPETLERILRVTRHRGFQIRQCEVQDSAADANLFSIKMQVVSVRKIVLLTKQLEKLFDVCKVEIAPQAAINFYQNTQHIEQHYDKQYSMV